MTEEEHPKLFISYCWSNQEHELKVLNLAENLVHDGVDVILDKWDLKEGQDKYEFMENMVNDPEIKKVALICDKSYQEKADNREGGVGHETQIITSEIYNNIMQNKFVAVIFEKDDYGTPCVPNYYKSRIHIDLEDQDRYQENYEQLIRWIYDKRLYLKPEIGKKPDFLNDLTSINLGTSTYYRRALDAIRNNKGNCKGAIIEYFDTYVKHLEKFRIPQDEIYSGSNIFLGNWDDSIVNNIEHFLPYRNVIVELFSVLAVYRNTEESHQIIYKFFETLIPFMYMQLSQIDRPDVDNFRFIIYELFLYAITIFIKNECFDAAAYLLNNLYFFEHKFLCAQTDSFVIFNPEIRFFKFRQERLKIKDTSLRAQLLKERANIPGLSFDTIMQTDFILFLRGCINYFNEKSSDNYWLTETLLNLTSNIKPFEIFARSKSSQYFNKIKFMLSINSKNDFNRIFHSISKGDINISHWCDIRRNMVDIIKKLLDYDNLDSYDGKLRTERIIL